MRYLEIYFEGPAWKLLPGIEQPKPYEVAVLRTDKASQVRRAVVQRDDDLLTPAEVVKHSDEVAAAKLKELETWAKYKCFSRRPKQGARNVIDCKWVLKWKNEFEATGVDGSSGKEQKSRRVIRARLTVRGFKDLENIWWIDTLEPVSATVSE